MNKMSSVAAILKIYFELLLNLKASWLETSLEVSRLLVQITAPPKRSFVISPEYHVFMVSYCDRSPSVFVVPPAGRPIKISLLLGFWPNLDEKIRGWSSLKFVLIADKNATLLAIYGTATQFCRTIMSLTKFLKQSTCLKRLYYVCKFVSSGEWYRTIMVFLIFFWKISLDLFQKNCLLNAKQKIKKKIISCSCYWPIDLGCRNEIRSDERTTYTINGQADGHI